MTEWNWKPCLSILRWGRERVFETRSWSPNGSIHDNVIDTDLNAHATGYIKFGSRIWSHFGLVFHLVFFYLTEERSLAEFSFFLIDDNVVWFN